MREIILTIFCDVDEFCKGFEAYCKEDLLEANSEKKGFFPKSSMALSEIMTIVILFHLSQYRTFKWYYKSYVNVSSTESDQIEEDGRRAVDMQRRLIRQERIGNQTRDQIDQEIELGTMSGMLNVTDIFQEIIDRLNDSALSEQDFVGKIHQHILHVLFELGKQRNAFVKEVMKQLGRQIALVAKQLAEQIFGQVMDQGKIAVVHIA